MRFISDDRTFASIFPKAVKDTIKDIERRGKRWQLKYDSENKRTVVIEITEKVAYNHKSQYMRPR